MLHSKKIIRIFSDLLAINSSLFIVYSFFYNDWSFIFKQEARITLVLVNLIWFFTLFNANPLYGRFEYIIFKEEIQNVLRNYILHFVFFTIILFFINVPHSQEHIFWFISFYGLLLISLFLGRYLLKILFTHSSRIETLNYVVIGHCKALSAIEKTLSDTHFGKVQYLGYFSKEELEGQKYLGEIDGLYDFLKTTKSNLILYASNEMPFLEMRQLMNYAKLNFIDFKIIPIEIEMFSSGINLEIHNGFPLLSVKNESIARIRNRFFKRGFDIVFSLLVIILILSWLYPIIVFLIRLESKGSALFLQKRIGYKNQPFTCYKFRSMVVHQETNEVTQASKNDQRVTKIGAFIRRTNIDEMPQFFNVFIGNMSVVGPRPHAVAHDIQYKNTMEGYILRHYTMPGITGWAQVNGWRGPTDTDQKIIGRAEHDIWYLRNWSFFLDIKIIWMTLFSSKSKENAF